MQDGDDRGVPQGLGELDRLVVEELGDVAPLEVEGKSFQFSPVISASVERALRTIR
jgi:hypothetical protein